MDDIYIDEETLPLIHKGYFPSEFLERYADLQSKSQRSYPIVLKLL